MRGLSPRGSESNDGYAIANPSSTCLYILCIGSANSIKFNIRIFLISKSSKKNLVYESND